MEFLSPDIRAPPVDMLTIRATTTRVHFSPIVKLLANVFRLLLDKILSRGQEDSSPTLLDLAHNLWIFEVSNNNESLAEACSEVDYGISIQGLLEQLELVPSRFDFDLSAAVPW